MGLIVRPVKVWHEETVEIQWQLPDGKVFWQRHTIPPSSVRDAIEHDRAELEQIRQQALGINQKTE